MTPTDYLAHVAAEVRAEMARQQKTLTELAALLEVSRQTAEARYNGDRPFDVVQLFRVARWLDVSVAQLHPDEPSAA